MSKRKTEEVGTWALRALAAVAAQQHENIEVEKLNYQMIVFGAISGDLDELVQYFKTYVDQAKQRIEASMNSKGDV